jgi:hypothetical protein
VASDWIGVGVKIDVLQFLTLPETGWDSRSGSARGFAKADSTDIVTPIDASGYGQWKHIKNLQGWPWDLKLYDANFVYDWVTEGANGWSTDINVGPKSFKKFVGNHASSEHGLMQDGLPIFPRMIDTVSNNYEINTPTSQTTYATFENCKQVGATVSLGAVTHKLQGPFQIDHEGDVGEVPTLIHQYFWNNNGVPTLEENYYALHFGWIAWKLQTLNSTTGLYEVTNVTNENKIFTVNDVKIVFPCF